MEYDEIREQKLEEIKTEMLRQQEKQKKASEAETHLDEALRLALSPEAKARLANIKLVNKNTYLKVAQGILYLYKSGRVKSKITDEQLKELLRKLSEKKEIQIKRK